MNAYLKPIVDELLQLWKGTYLTAPGVFVPIRCALLCVSCDLPATQKVCVVSHHLVLYKDVTNA